MRPSLQTRTRSSGLARARMLLKSKLGWLEGYPYEGRWVTVPRSGETEVLELDRNHLRRATYTARKLAGEFPRAMPVLVGDVDEWHGVVTSMLDRLKPWIHHGRTPPPELWQTELPSRTTRRRAAALLVEHPRLAPLVRTLSWVLATRMGSAPKALGWVEREATALGVLLDGREATQALPLAVRCVHLAVELGPRALVPLMRLLGEPTLTAAVTHGGAEYLQQVKNQANTKTPEEASRPTMPKPRFGTSVDDLVVALGRSDRARAKRMLSLLGLLDLGPAASAWSEWWPTVLDTIRSSQTIRAHVHHPPDRKARLAGQRRAMEGLIATAPPDLDPSRLTELLVAAADSGFTDSFGDARRILERLPGDSRAAMRYGLLVRWVRLRLGPGCWWEHRRVPRLLRSLAGFVRRAPLDDPALGAWRRDAERAASSGQWSSGIDDDLLDEDLEPGDIARYFDTHAWLREHATELDRGDLDACIVRLLEALHDTELAARLTVPMHAHDLHDHWYDAEVLRAAWTVAQPDADGFPSLVKALDDLGETIELSAMPLVEALLPAVRHDRALLRELLLHEDKGVLLRSGRKLAVLAALKQPLPEGAALDDAQPQWLEEYPEPLHEPLRWLATISPRAEAIAAKALRSVRHGRGALEAELRAVEQMMTGAPRERRAVLTKRANTLRDRLARAPATTSTKKLERLHAKLRRRGGLELVGDAESRADEALRVALARSLRLDPSTPWLLDDRLLRLMVPLQDESGTTRRLARTILQRRAAPPPWDLREHPANASFVESLVERGIDPAPWVDGLGEQVVRSKGRRMHLRLEDDPLELFHMGRHFGTCLSPGHCNFYSVFTNAADLNKRVLFARDDDGVVIGRRLLCLTGEGAILAFHSYCHDDTWRFEPRSDAFVRRLAEAMGTTLVSRGTVPTLVAEQWYDDGPIDISGQHPELEDGSPFRRALAELRPSAVPGLVATTFGRTHLDEALAPVLLALPELDERPELAAPLMLLIRRPDRLPSRAVLRLGTLLARSGGTDHVRTHLAEPIAHALWSQNRELRWMDSELLELLARAAPSEALRLLRRTRERGVRRWEDEDQCERLLAGSIAMEALHRPRQALRLCRLATSGHRAIDHASRARAARQAGRLEALLGEDEDS